MLSGRLYIYTENTLLLTDKFECAVYSIIVCGIPVGPADMESIDELIDMSLSMPSEPAIMQRLFVEQLRLSVAMALHDAATL